MPPVFTPKRVSVPGLLSDDGLAVAIDSLRQQKTQTSVPALNSAMDVPAGVQGLPISMPSPAAPAASIVKPTISLGAGPAPQSRPTAPTVDVPAPVLQSQATPGIGMLSAEQAAIEQEQRVQAADADVKAVEADNELSDQLRNMTDEEAAAMGIPRDPLGLSTPAVAETYRKADEAYLAQTQERADFVRAAPPPTMTWWLDAAQVGARAAAQTGTSALKYPFSAFESLTYLATGIETGKTAPRGWLDQVDTALNKILPGDPSRAKDFVSELAAGGGSFIPFLLAGYLGAAVGLPAGVTAGGLGAAATGNQMYEDAEKFDATMLQKSLALLQGSALGMTEAIPIDRMFMRADVGTGGLLRRMLANTAASTVEEFTQEFSQAIGEDMIAKYGAGYDPDRKLDMMSWLRQGAIGGIVGGVAGGATTLVPAAGGGNEAAQAAAVEEVFTREQARFNAIVGADTAVLDQPEAETGAAPAEAVDGANGGSAAPVVTPSEQQGAAAPAAAAGPVVTQPIVDGVARINEAVAQRSAAQTTEPVALLDPTDPMTAVQVAPAVQTPEFQTWFSGSQVTDEAGAPITVYHGTGADFSTFDTAKRGASTQTPSARSAFWFSASSANAEEFAKLAAGRGAGDSPSVMPVYLALKNPLVVDATGGAVNFDTAIAQAKAEGRDGVVFRNASDTPVPPALRVDGVATDADPRGNFIADTLPAFAAGEVTREEAQAELDDTVAGIQSDLADARAAGDQDEITFNETELQTWSRIADAFRRDPGSVAVTRGAGPADVFAAFEPTQIKSATGNSGAFDPANPDINEQVANPILPTKQTIDAVVPDAVELSPLPGIEKGLAGPIPIVVKAAKAYANAVGLPLRRQRDYVRVDTGRAARIARAYTDMEHQPADPAVQAAYRAMADETTAQYQFVKATGLKIETIMPGQPDPYPNGPRDVLKDIASGHIWYFPTEQGFGSSEFDPTGNPLLDPTPEVSDNGQPMVVNDLFRVVHDFFGHGMEGAGFGARGEENAWQAHMRLFSEAAVPAMTSETRGQNSWVNYGPFGEQNRADPRNTVYADQKTGIMPSWTWREGVSDSQANALAAPVQTDDAGAFRDALLAAKAASRFGGAVTVYSPAKYAKMKTFLSPDGLSGFALDGTDIVSVFSQGGGRLRSLIDAAIANGGTTLDAFDTGTAAKPGLPQMYASLGFVETGRVPFDPKQAPADWPAELGKPDVVFMELATDSVIERMDAGAQFPGITSTRKPSDIGRGYGDYITYTEPSTGGVLRIVERIGALRDVSVVDFVVPEEHRGKGVGKALMDKVLAEHPSLMGQVSSKIAAKMAYDKGRRPYNSPEATLEDVYAILDADSSVNLMTPDGALAAAEKVAEIEQMTGTSSVREAYTAEPTRPARGVPDLPQPNVGDDVKLTQISRDFTKLLDLTVRHGRLVSKGGNTMGEYNRKTATIRLRVWSDLSTLVHEGGHALNDAMAAPLDAFVQRNVAEIMRIGVSLYAGDLSSASPQTRQREGFAEYFRVYALTPDYARNKWPGVTADFETTLRAADPIMLDGLNNIASRFQAWLQLPSAKLIRNMVVDGRREQGINAAIKELKDLGFKSWFEEHARRSVEWSTNRFAPLNQLVTDLLNQGEANTGAPIDLKRADDPRTLIRLARNAGSRAMVEVTDGVYGYKSTQPMSRGLRDALMTSQGVDPNTTPGSLDEERMKDFSAYLVARRSLDEYRRFDEAKIDRPPIGASKGDVLRAIKDYETQYGDSFTQAADMVHEYGMALWQKQYDAGLMAKETYEDGLERQFYVPLQRDMSDKKANFGPSALTAGSPSLVKRFRGSDRDIVDPMAVLMQKTFALETLINENEVISALALLADRVGQAGALVERIPASQVLGMTMTVEDAARQLSKDDTLTPADAQDLMTLLGASIKDGNSISLFRREQVSTAGENILFFWENGKPAAIQLKDGDLGADVVNAMQAVGRENMPLFTGLITGVSTAFRTAITSWPDFLVVNYIRDQMSAWVLTDVGFKPFVTGIRGMSDEIRQKQWAKSYNAAQGIMGGMNVAALHDAHIDRDISALRSKGYIAQAFRDKTPFLGAVRGFAEITSLSETGTRVGLYRSAYERAKADGLSDYEASVEAAYAATDYIDFGLNGSRMTFYRRTIPFLNAQLQGLYKMMRVLGADEVAQRKGLKFVLGAYFKSTKNMPLSRIEKDAINTGRKAWVKMATLGMISALLHFLFRDDPDYQEASEYMRVTGWVIPMGNGRVFYVPKPFELALMANAVERGLEWASGDSQAPARFLRGAALSLIPPTSPTSAQLATELAMNKDTFTGRDIVPTYMQALEPALQYDNYTSSMAKWMGQQFGWSPLVVDHVLSGLGASAYRDISSVLNATDPTRPSLDDTDTPLLRRFVRDARRGSVSAADFWSQASNTTGRLERASQTYKRFVEYGNELGANAYLASLSADEKAYAMLMTHFDTDAKRLNPFYRARQVTTVISGMRREMASELGLGDTTIKDMPESFQMSAKQKQQVDEVLSEVARREMRNTLIATKQAGWADKAILPLGPTLDMLLEVSPDTYDEYMRRAAQRKIYNDEAVYEYWPEVRDRLIQDGEFAVVSDAIAIAGVVF